MDYSELSQQYDAAFEALSPRKWHKLDVAERVEVLQKIEDFAAMQSKRPPATFQVDANMPKARNGVYNTETNTITQNIRCIKARTSDLAVKNLLHEGRHAYQYDCVCHPERHKELSSDTIEQWKPFFDEDKSKNTYVEPKRGEDFQKYFQQSVEKDARAFAQSQYQSYVNKNILSIQKNQILSGGKTMWNFHKKDQGQSQSNAAVQSSGQSQLSKSSRQGKSFIERLQLSPEDQKKQEEVIKKYNTEHQTSQGQSQSSKSSGQGKSFVERLRLSPEDIEKNNEKLREIAKNHNAGQKNGFNTGSSNNSSNGQIEGRDRADDLARSRTQGRGRR